MEASEARARKCNVLQGSRSREIEFSREAAQELLNSGEFFWLDLHNPHSNDFELFSEVFNFHPLAIEDSEHFGQRPKMDEYDDFVFLVVYGAAPDEDLLMELHCFFSERFLITVHHDYSSGLDLLRSRYARKGAQVDEPAIVLYKVIDSLVDSYFPILADFDDRIDDLQDRIFADEGDETQLREIFDMKRLLVGVRKIVTPQRDMFAGLVGGVRGLPGMSEEHERYFRDIYDHLIRISDLVDTYRDLLAGALDVYLSTVSNRMNVVMKQLTIMATIFLPLSFLTGFFGQNFTWLTDGLTGSATFLILGVGLEVIIVLLLVVWFKRRNWL